MKLSEIIFNNTKPSCKNSYFTVDKEKCCAWGAVIEYSLPELVENILDDCISEPVIFDKLNYLHNITRQIPIKNILNAVDTFCNDNHNWLTDKERVSIKENTEAWIEIYFADRTYLTLNRMVIILNDIVGLNKQAIGQILQKLGY